MTPAARPIGVRPALALVFITGSLVCGACARPLAPPMREPSAPVSSDPTLPIDWADYGLVLYRVVAGDSIHWQGLRDSPELISGLLAQLEGNGPLSAPALYPSAESRAAYYINAHNLLVVADLAAIAQLSNPKSRTRVSVARARQIDGRLETSDSLGSKALEALNGDWRVKMTLFTGRRDGPPLWRRPLIPDMLDAQLDEITRVAIASPRVAQIDHGSPKRLLLCEELYEIREDLVADYDRRLKTSGATMINVLLEWATPFNRETLNSAVGYEVALMPRDARVPLAVE